MGMELAYLAIDRAPYTGRLHTCLLIVALDADHRDLVKMPHDALAWQARISRRNAQEALAQFEADGFLTRFRYRSPKNAQATRFQFHRDALFRHPVRKKIVTGVIPARSICGKPRSRQEKAVLATIHAASRDAAARVKALLAFDDTQRLAALRRLRP